MIFILSGTYLARKLKGGRIYTQMAYLVPSALGIILQIALPRSQKGVSISFLSLSLSLRLSRFPLSRLIVLLFLLFSRLFSSETTSSAPTSLPWSSASPSPPSTLRDTPSDSLLPEPSSWDTVLETVSSVSLSSLVAFCFLANHTTLSFIFFSVIGPQAFFTGETPLYKTGFSKSSLPFPSLCSSFSRSSRLTAR